MKSNRLHSLLFLVGSWISLHAADEAVHGCEGGKGCNPQFSMPQEALGRQSQGSFPKPPVVRRIEWGCPDGQTSRWSPGYTVVTHLIVHHSATANTSSNWAATVRSIWRYHTEDRGWGDIGYNYLIDPNGVIYEGRAGGDNVVAAHFSCRNGGTLGVCMLGDFSAVRPTGAALASLKKLLAWKADQRNFDPAATALHAGTGLDLYRISGHRDGNDAYPDNACTTTTCPGSVLYGLLPEIRQEVHALIQPPMPVVQTLPALNISPTSAQLHGSILDPGASSIIERRFEWAKSSLAWGAGAPGIDSGVLFNAAISGPDQNFSATLGNLDPCTSYKFRVYARNAEGWSDAAAVNVVSFTTAQAGDNSLALTVAREGGGLQLLVGGPCGEAFTLERSTDLREWTGNHTAVIPPDGRYRIQEPIDEESEAAFYRVTLRVE